jgi:hypothetical protein
LLAPQEITSKCFQWYSVQLSNVASIPKNIYMYLNNTYISHVVGRGSVHWSFGDQYLLRHFVCDSIQYLQNTVENLQPRKRGGGSNRAEPKFLRSQGIDSKESLQPAYVAPLYCFKIPTLLSLIY